MHILIVDPQFEGPADIERAAAGPEPTITIWQTPQSGPVPTEVFAACDALINCRSRHPVTAEVVAKMPRCRIVAQAGVGFNHIDLEACTARGIPVCNTPDYGTTEVADHALALALDLTRGISAYDAKLRARAMGWQARDLKTIRRLRGASFGVLGMGRIGTAAALRAKAFETEVAFCDPYLAPGIEKAFGFRREASAEALLASCDIVSVHTPLTEETAGIIGEASLEAARPGLVLVNTSRGGTMDLDAVEAALRDGRLGGAGLDVLPQEPPDYAHPLMQAFAASEPWLDGRLVITPHAAFYSPDSLRDMRRIATETVMNYLREGRVRSCVNEALLRGPGARAAA
ncbi:MAG: C-terminal binding protein [Pseudomonadota bacterium]